MHERTTVLAALPQPRHAASAVADVAASHAGLCGPVLPIECVRTHASAISTGSLAVFRAFSTLSPPGAAARPAALVVASDRALQIRFDCSTYNEELHCLVFGARARLTYQA